MFVIIDEQTKNNYCYSWGDFVDRVYCEYYAAK